MSEADWKDGQLRTLGMWYGRGASPVGRLLLLFNAEDAPQAFSLPQPPPGVPWICQFDTSDDTCGSRGLGGKSSYLLRDRSVVLLEC
jgi:hypothetical protein